MIVVEQFEVTRSPVSALELLLEIAYSQSWLVDLSDAEATEKCTNWAPRFLDRLRREYNTRIQDGRPTRFEFNSSSEMHVQGACFPEPSDSPELKAAKVRRASGGAYLELLRSVTPREFEGVCRGVLSLLGCEDPVLTRASNDQGIDFFGTLSLEGRMIKGLGLPSVDKNFRVWLVGQAKQYSAAVSTPELRELAGAVALARASTFADDGSALTRLDVRVFDPVFYLFLAAGPLSADSRRLASRSGIIALDGESVATLLADSGVGVVEGEYDSNEAMRWIGAQLS
ncbi:restriction endonuclease [Agromyces sp. CCNWLW203]